MEMNRSTRLNFRTQNLVLGLLLAAILGVAAYATHRYQVRWDLTANNRHSLAEQSVKAVQAFPEGVALTVYVQDKGEQKQGILELLERYRVENTKLTIRFVDPDLDPAAARREDVAVYGTVVLRNGEKSEKVTEVTEENITNALIRLSKGSAKVVRMVSGHGEHPFEESAPAPGMPGQQASRQSYNTVVTLLKGEGYRVEKLNLAEVEAVPEETGLVVLAGAQGPLFPVEVERLTQWFGKDGRLLLLLEPGINTGLEPFLADQGITPLAGTVIDPTARLFGAGVTTPLITRYDASHPITKGMSDASFFPEAVALELQPSDSRKEGSPQRTRLLTGADRGWLEVGSLAGGSVEFNAGEDKQGPLLLGVATEAEKRRLVVIGDSDFAADAYVDFSGNSRLVLNAVRWLAADENFIAIKPKPVTDGGLVLSGIDAIILSWGLVAVIPLLLVGTGLTLWLRRKRR
ncbi:MAG: GldG family protein [Magnetococcales bacterium]|nr:GldG family protein [Magnetococcales bacterium]MBF0156784.1 GldG family protein [Magnetococcales bacterium]